MDRILLPNDEPTVDDLLGHGRQVAQVADFIDRTQPPYVLGVHGDWGTGKTSFLLKVQAELEQPHRVRKTRVVFFEAWRYQFEEQPVVALLHTIRAHFELSSQVWDSAGKLAKVGAWTGLHMLDTLTRGVTATALEQGKAWEQRNFAVPLSANSFRSTFEQAIRELTDGGDSKLVVLIDDLDRCADAAVVRLLESIKLYLLADNCVFVIAADRRAVVRAIAKQLFLQEDQGEGISGRALRDAEEYSEKLFQSVVPLRLARDLDDLVGATWRVTAAERGAAPGTYVVPPQVLAQRLELVSLQRSHAFLPPNPRKVKRFLVELHERVQAHEKRFGPLASLSLAVAVQAIQTFHPDIYRVLENQPAFWEAIAEYAELGPAATAPHPLLASLDVPDWGAPTTETASPSKVEATTFHDPGDIHVFLAARVVRLHMTAPERQLWRLLRGQDAPPSSPTATLGPDGT